MSMVDGFPYKEEVGGSSPSAPTKTEIRGQRSEVSAMGKLISDLWPLTSGSHAES